MTLQTIPWADLYNALQTGVVDGAWSLWGSLVEERHFEVLKYYTALDWSWDSCNIAMNRKVYEKLPQDLKGAIFKAGREAEARDFKERLKTDEEYKKKVVAAGLTVYTPTAAEKEVFRKKANMPAVWDELAKPWLDKAFPGQNMTKKVQDELEKVRIQATKK
jgi:C4-dicarboxylate-binding protein DctP